MARLVATAILTVVLGCIGTLALISDPPPQLYTLKARLQGEGRAAGLVAVVSPTSVRTLPVPVVTTVAGPAVRPTVAPRTLEPVALDQPTALPGERGFTGPAGAKLELSRTTECVPGFGGGAQFVGSVRNVTDGPLEGLQLLLSYYDREGTEIASATLHLEPAELLPGESVPLHHSAPTGRPMARCSFVFHDGTGAVVLNRVER